MRGLTISLLYADSLYEQYFEVDASSMICFLVYITLTRNMPSFCTSVYVWCCS